MKKKKKKAIKNKEEKNCRTLKLTVRKRKYIKIADDSIKRVLFSFLYKISKNHHDETRTSCTTKSVMKKLKVYKLNPQ